jgi:hypothetical protein
MSLENPNRIESSVSKNTKQRRTFLKRATAGAVIASIPGRSAWAGIAGSIVASGHGSDFQSGECTRLLTAEDIVSFGYSNLKFVDVFPGTPFNMSGGAKNTLNNDNEIRGYRFKPILEWAANLDDNGLSDPKPNRKGINDVNLGLIVIYLNAINHGSNGIFYPVLEQHNNDPVAFANYLYSAALSDPAGVGTLLSDTLSTYSNSISCI